jgi:hypothetical protein
MWRVKCLARRGPHIVALLVLSLTPGADGSIIRWPNGFHVYIVGDAEDLHWGMLHSLMANRE